MSKKQKNQIGKFLSLILRHQPEVIGIQLDESGWAKVDELLAGLKKHGKGITFDQLETLVTSNNKQRYRFNEDKSQICANQGHSLKVDLALKPITPPEILYHGTATRFLDSINQQGLVKGSRHHVHLSADIETAKNVGQRHGKVVILVIQAQTMQQAGYSFYCSENGVWLVDSIPVEYFSQQ